MKTNNVTDAQLAAFAKRSHELYCRITKGTLSVERVLAGMQDLIRGKFSKPAALAQMIADAGFRPGRFNPNITERNFPLDKQGAYDASGLRLFGGHREWTIAEVEAAVESEGGRLEGLVRGLAYLKANPGALGDGPIVFPASSWKHPDSYVGIPCANLYDGEPWLSLFLHGRDDRWDRRYRFLVSGK